MLQFTVEDVSEELKFWSTTVFGYVLDANPPWNVINGFLKRIWKDLQIDCISSMRNVSKTKAMASAFLMFYSKPVIIQPWTPKCCLVKKTCLGLPIWGTNCLSKLAGLIGKFFWCDTFTSNQTFLGFAKVLVEVEMNQVFPRTLSFLDELGVFQEVVVEYDWLPVECRGCKAIGTTVEQCRKNKSRMVWRPKVVAPVVDPLAGTPRPSAVTSPVEEVVVIAEVP
ncbi:hypothetical protein RND81_10G030300 [Saponaria officinalis]|uniref:DUF4283 domain-containing protein n=1 Tax=Saponaria officinalis TaxID=3572 RepID=A0AAW1HY00_SAPOF